jgi:dihydropteroate synthase
MNASAADSLESRLAMHYPQRATAWKLRSRTLAFTQLPLLMGIVNVTPDSFSDGGRFFDAQAASDHGLRLVDEGADILDVGGESTRPYSTPVEAAEELRRTSNVVSEICRRTRVPVSIDTSKAAVARAALDAGAEIINDVTGLAGDAGMLPLAAAAQVGVCAMHMQGTPLTMQDNPSYVDVVSDIERYLSERRDALLSAGIERGRICLDPGVGFGKTHQHNLTLVAHCWRFHALGCPVLVGPSRKGFIGKVLQDKDADRMAGTIGVCLSLAQQGVQILRVHDVAAVRQALLLFGATGGVDGAELQLDS